MITFKSEVRATKIYPEIFTAIVTANTVFGDVTVTSLNDGSHAGRGVDGEAIGPHYNGRAVDLRVKDLDPGIRADRIAQLRARLTALNPKYVVLWESQGTVNEHVHVQYGHARPIDR